jgi:predicted kinase
MTLMELITPISPNWDALLQHDWARAMQACPQEPEYHAEGDVWTHTCMVMDALRAFPEYQALPPAEQNVLLAAALLHDVAKPQCTVVENGRISSPRHAKVGEKEARTLLWGLDFATREQVCALVRLHGLPLWGFEKSNPVRSAILASWRVRNELTYLLAKADVLGRICDTQAELLYRLEMYRELCLENNCFYAPHAHFDAHSRFRYYWSDETWPVQIFDDTAFEVVILSGIAGSGKDTFYQKQYAHLPVVSLDQIRKAHKIKPDDRSGQGKVAQIAYERAREFCRKKQSFVWNSTNLTAELRARLIQTLRVYNPRFTLVFVETSTKNIYERRRDDINIQVLDRMIRQVDIPVPGEAHEVRSEIT